MHQPLDQSIIGHLKRCLYCITAQHCKTWIYQTEESLHVKVNERWCLVSATLGVMFLRWQIKSEASLSPLIIRWHFTLDKSFCFCCRTATVHLFSCWPFLAFLWPLLLLCLRLLLSVIGCHQFKACTHPLFMWMLLTAWTHHQSRGSGLLTVLVYSTFSLLLIVMKTQRINGRFFLYRKNTHSELLVNSLFMKCSLVQQTSIDVKREKRSACLFYTFQNIVYWMVQVLSWLLRCLLVCSGTKQKEVKQPSVPSLLFLFCVVIHVWEKQREGVVSVEQYSTPCPIN